VEHGHILARDEDRRTAEGRTLGDELLDEAPPARVGLPDLSTRPGASEGVASIPGDADDRNTPSRQEASRLEAVE